MIQKGSLLLLWSRPARGSSPRRRRCAATDEMRDWRSHRDGPARCRRPRLVPTRLTQATGSAGWPGIVPISKARVEAASGLVLYSELWPSNGVLTPASSGMALGAAGRRDPGLDVIRMMTRVMPAQHVGVERGPLGMALRRLAPGVEGVAGRADSHHWLVRLLHTCESRLIWSTEGARRRTLTSKRSASLSASIPLKSCGVLGSAITNVQRTPRGSSSELA